MSNTEDIEIDGKFCFKTIFMKVSVTYIITKKNRIAYHIRVFP